MPNRVTTAGFSSVLSFPKVTRPEYSLARASTIGETIRQGPHPGAQQSTNTTGCLEMNVQKSKSVIVMGCSVFSGIIPFVDSIFKIPGFALLFACLVLDVF